MNGLSLRTNIVHGNYNDQEYNHYIAIDWALSNAALARCTRKNSRPKVMEFESDVKIVKKYLSELKGTIILTIEETTTSQWLYVELKRFVDRVVICDPYRNRLLSEGPKTDKIDAKKLLQLLRAGLLKEVFHCCDSLYELRKLESAYNDLINAGVRLQNQRSAFYRAKGCQYTKHSSAELKERTKEQKYSQFITDLQDQHIEQYRTAKVQFERMIDEVVRENQVIKNLTGLPGIGNISALTIYSRVIQPGRFKKSGKYLSYCGLVWHKKESGNKSYGKRQGRYCRQLKSIYKRSARITIYSGQGPLFEYYETLVDKGLTHSQAVLMAARYLAKVSLGMMKTGQKYEPYRWRKTEKDTA